MWQPKITIIIVSFANYIYWFIELYIYNILEDIIFDEYFLRYGNYVFHGLSPNPFLECQRFVSIASSLYQPADT